MADPTAAEANFEGHPGRECTEHRTVGPHRAWCFDCTEWCYPAIPCRGCELPAVRAQRDSLQATIEQHNGLLSSIALYIDWRYVTRQLTTPQKDLFADALEREAIRVHGPDGDEPDPEMARLPSYAARWWRPDAALDTPTEETDRG